MLDNFTVCLYEVRNTLRSPTRNIFLGSNNTRPPKENSILLVISSNDTSTTYKNNYLVRNTLRPPNQKGNKKNNSSVSSLAQNSLDYRIRIIDNYSECNSLQGRSTSTIEPVVCACMNTGPYHFFYSVITCITSPYSIMLYYLPMFFHPTAADYNKNITTLLSEITYPTNIVRTDSKVVNLYLFEDIKVAKPLEVVEEMEKQ
ncbi:hypothetical protein U3516DRAFT_861511 [Neocallimastix sp. 'constans']